MVNCPVRVRTKHHFDAEIKRKLGEEGKPLVKKGAAVTPEKVIARVEVGCQPLVFDLPGLLKAKKPFSAKHLLKKPGEKVKKGEPLVRLRSFLFGTRTLIAPRAGQIKELKKSSGELIFLPETKQEVAVPSLFWGEVVKVGQEEVVIKTQLLEVFGVLGSGQAFGKLILCGAGESNLAFLSQEDGGQGIFVFEEGPSRATLEKLKICGAQGVIVGGVHGQDFDGCRRRGLPFLVTEGLGKLKMAADLWAVLQGHQGRTVFLEGEKKRLRIPLEKKEAKKEAQEVDQERELKKGDRVRLVGEPGPIGCQGKVVAVGAKESRLESGFKAILVKIEAGEEVLEIPANNLEILVTQ